MLPDPWDSGLHAPTMTDPARPEAIPRLIYYQVRPQGHLSDAKGLEGEGKSGAFSGQDDHQQEGRGGM